MKTNFILAILVIALAVIDSTSTEAFQEKFLIRAMGQRNFSASLMSSAVAVARDLKDQTGCLFNSNMKPVSDRFIICDLNETMIQDSRCHIINLANNAVDASGPVAFGTKGTTHVDMAINENSKKTLLGVFVTKADLDEKSKAFTRQLLRANGTALPSHLNPVFKPESSRIPASTKGSTTFAGEFANRIKSDSGNMLWVNHSVKHPYDNACGNFASRQIYESDMNDIQLAEHRAKMKKPQAERGIASEKKKDVKRGLASEKQP